MRSLLTGSVDHLCQRSQPQLPAISGAGEGCSRGSGGSISRLRLVWKEAICDKALVRFDEGIDEHLDVVEAG